MPNREEIEKAMTALEAQRSVLGDAAIDLALAALKQEMLTEDKGRVEEPGETTLVLSAERKLVTVMFADISGFTALSEELDAETVHEIMNACFARLVPVVAKYGGTVDKFIGDEIMALFGAPVTHENDPERALLASLEMMDALKQFNRERGLDLGLHFGINTGPVIAGGVGSDQRQDYSVMGDAVNLASRLENLSERGEILVGPVTHRLTEKLFSFEERPPARLKGKAQSVKPYLLVGRRASSHLPETLMARRVSSRLVGREEEFATLLEHLRRLSDGRGGIVSIIGEAGLGKSRLFAEVRDRAARDERFSGIQWLEGRTLSLGQAVSYRPFQEILFQYAGIAERFTPGEAWESLESKVRELFGDETSTIAPYLAELCFLDVPEVYATRIQYLEADAMRRQIFLASRKFFEAVSRNRPAVLVFEDLHWVDDASAALLEHLLPLVLKTPLLLVMISRNDEQSAFARISGAAREEFPDHYEELGLSPLSPKHSDLLVQNLLEMADLSPAVRNSILKKAEGNPFFLEEIIRSLIDAGSLARDPATGRWQTSELKEVTVPDTIQGVILARIDRLDEDLRRVLRSASVIGRNFFYQVLKSVEDADKQLDSELADLQRYEFIRAKNGRLDAEYMFKHAVAQEAAYESILTKKRRELHVRVARAVETLFADRLEDVYSLLASHYARAEIWDKAQHYLLLAGDYASRLAADAEALAHYRQALDAYQRAFGDQWPPLERASLDRKMGEALFRLGDHSQALEYFHRALAYLGRPLPTAVWAVRLAIVREMIRQAAHRFLHRYLCPRSCMTAAPEVEEELRLYEVMGWIYAFSEYERFLLLALRGLNTSEHTGFCFGIARGLVGLGLICDLSGLFRLARWYHRRAKAAANEIEYPPARALVQTGSTVHHVCRAEWHAAVGHAGEAVRLCRETGDLRCLGYAHYMTAVSLAYQGDLQEALAHAGQAITLGEDGADRQVRCWGLAVQGFVLRMEGRTQEALASLTEASDVADAIRDHVVTIWSASEIARCHLRQGSPDQARTALEKTSAVMTRHSALRIIWVPSRGALAEGAIAAVESQEPPKRREALGDAARMCSSALKNGRVYLPLLPEAERLMGTFHWLGGRKRRAAGWWKRSIAHAHARGQRHDEALTLLEQAIRMQDATLLRRGERILEEIAGSSSNPYSGISPYLFGSTSDY